MKFTILQENLKQGLSLVLRSISNKAQLPVLSNVLMVAKDNNIDFIGTDLELGIKTRVGAKVDVEGAVTVPAKMFSAFVSSLPPKKIDVELDGDTLKVSNGVHNASFQTISADEYPEFPSVDGISDSTVEFDRKSLFSAIRKVLYAVAKDSMRPILTGVLFEIGKKGVRVVGTDGFRLAMSDIDGVKVDGDEFSVVVPAKAVNEVLSVDGDSVKLVYLKEKNQVFFVGGDVVVLSQVLDGSYPNYKKIIPSEFGTSMVVDRGELLDGVSVSQVFAKNNSNILKWKISDGLINIESESPEFGKNDVSIKAKVDGDGGEIAFNGKFLLDFLQNSDADEIWIGMNDSLSPGAFKSVGDDKFLYIAMPINL